MAVTRVTTLPAETNMVTLHHTQWEANGSSPPSCLLRGHHDLFSQQLVGHQCPTLTACQVLYLESKETFSEDTAIEHLGQNREQLGEGMPRAYAVQL